MSIDSTKIFIPRGPTSVRQFYALLPYDSKVARIRVSGAQLKLWLEHAARYFNFSFEPELFNRQFPGSDYDMIEGVDYALDLGKPVGNRVVSLKYQGKPVQPDHSFTMAISAFRLHGGGGYMEAIGFKGEAENLTASSLRNLVLKQVLSRPTLTPAKSNNWRTIPSLDRERVMNQDR